MEKQSVPHSLIITLMVFLLTCGGEADREPAALPAAKPAIAESIDHIIAPGTAFENIIEDMPFDNAGALCWDGGTLFFANSITPPESSRTYRMEPDGTITLIREGNGRTLSIVPSGRGTYYCCELLEHRVSEMDRDGNILDVAAGEYNGVRLDSPNDLFVDAQGGFYFSDPHIGSDPMQDTAAVYYVRPDGTLIRVIDDLEFPNGIAFSPDNSTLYVTNTRGADKGRYVFAYDINPDGTLSNKRPFCEIRLTPENEENPRGTSGADACAVDTAGNLFVATAQGIGIQVFNVAGTYLGAIPPGGRTNSCRFGGPDRRTLYATTPEGVFAIPTLVPGLVIPPVR